MQNQCLTPSIIYQADVENNANKGTKIYFGLEETSFKERFRNHKDFNHEQYRKRKELPKYMRSLKVEQIMSKIRWSIVEKVHGSTKTKFSPLYLAETVHLTEHLNDNR